MSLDKLKTELQQRDMSAYSFHQPFFRVRKTADYVSRTGEADEKFLYYKTLESRVSSAALIGDIKVNSFTTRPDRLKRRNRRNCSLRSKSPASRRSPALHCLSFILLKGLITSRSNLIISHAQILDTNTRTS